MEEVNINRLDLQRNFGKQMKSSLSGRSSPRNSPSFRRINSSRTPRKEGRSSSVFSASWFRSNRIVLWLLLITLWAYAGFYVQSRWAHGDNKEGIFGNVSTQSDEDPVSEQNHRRALIVDEDNSSTKIQVGKNHSDSEDMDGILEKKGKDAASHPPILVKKKSKKSRRSSRRGARGKQVTPLHTVNNYTEVQEVQEEDIPRSNSSYGLLVGPFGSLEDAILEWSPEKRSGTCDRRSEFQRLVWSRKFVLVFHELSMTGAPLSMMELATELLSCGATVSAVVLSQKGGLMPELARRKIKIVEDKEKVSFKKAMKADLVIAGSAVCASWIEQYLDHSTATASRQIVWWIMENRREYFDRSKSVLSRVRMLIFLSDLQSKQWLAWCAEENIKLMMQPALVTLSVNDELAFVAGIPCSLNTPAFSIENMLEKRQLLRKSVREELGLTDDDMLVMSLSSINPGKGHFLLLESVRYMIEQKSFLDDVAIDSLAEKDGYYQSMNNSDAQRLGNMRKLFSDNVDKKAKTIKVLIGSVGSKSNKVKYVKAILGLLSHQPNLSKSVLWTPATTRVASLYAAADVYVINSQGLGETFGRVTIEAMAFGLPVLGTDAGGTKEIVEHNLTGLLHPLGRPGSHILSENLRYLLQNPSARQEMGIRGREKVEKMYLKKHMYKLLARVLFKSMRIK
ncbi:hypothetical protein DCAR_0624983 [Daucus carota subsp. sativus]|uniref:Glycosyl transferase family 1 domain-containing protein n=1 Tax=Daucus carota subsp. sativus TaxID=79200 RepID=A0A164W5R5_DAUCS|nr:PREDICTED: uncharacterized protein LOC108228146 [Daucus carota subsp. sativus]WOH05564.1 hypothetical protein DCAR_0624983 [Daucus carota subsp. sativus]